MKTIPLGLCQCGCGQPTKTSDRTDRKRGWAKGEPRQFLLGHSKHNTGSCHWNWSDGRKRDGQHGYIDVRAVDHPRARNGYVREHILIVERAMGKLLRRTAPVHHVDGGTSHNANSNLVACDSAAYHQLLEQRTRAFNACGDPSARRCAICGGYDQTDMYHGARQSRHRDCHRAYIENRKAQRHNAPTTFHTASLPPSA